jgi:hypothetical protein
MSHSSQRRRAGRSPGRLRLGACGALALFTLAPGAVIAQESLYGALPPRDSAWLRFANALPGEASLQVDTKPAQRLGTAPQQRIGAYAVVEGVEGRQVALRLEAGVHEARLSLAVKPGASVTVLAQAGTDGAPVLRAWTDQTEFNQLRARLSFYNAVPGCEGGLLTLAENGAAVMKDVAPATAAVRSVNPVAAQLAAACGGRAPVPVTLAGLEAGSTYSIWLMPRGDGNQAFLAQDVVTPWKPPPGG